MFACKLFTALSYYLNAKGKGKVQGTGQRACALSYGSLQFVHTLLVPAGTGRYYYLYS